MEVWEKVEERTLMLSLSGEMDHHGVRDMLRRVERAIDMALPRTLTLDFSILAINSLYLVLSNSSLISGSSPVISYCGIFIVVVSIYAFSLNGRDNNGANNSGGALNFYNNSGFAL